MDLQKKVRLRNVRNPFLTIEPESERLTMFETVNTPQPETDRTCKHIIRQLWKEDNNRAQIFQRDAKDKLVDYAMLGSGSSMVAVDGTHILKQSRAKKPYRIAGIATSDAETGEKVKALFKKRGYQILEPGKFLYGG
ncbi:hypothetical protein KY362_00540 [Candidatus Woesearchaeota archaeon]|nr:hypothetical protein [Candidatus Woesearchaeota archaeon]